MTPKLYTSDGRLADVIALIQVLALDTYTYRSEKGIQEKELQGCPVSAASWGELARQHPEFFRVDDDKSHNLSLVARHVLPKEQSGTPKPPLQGDFMFSLIQTAISLHDRESAKYDKWMPLWAVLIGGIFGTASTLLTLWLKPH